VTLIVLFYEGQVEDRPNSPLASPLHPFDRLAKSLASGASVSGPARVLIVGLLGWPHLSGRPMVPPSAPRRSWTPANPGPGRRGQCSSPLGGALPRPGVPPRTPGTPTGFAGTVGRTGAKNASLPPSPSVTANSDSSNSKRQQAARKG